MRLIEEKQVVQNDTTVLDCACGSGILSGKMLEKYPFLRDKIVMLDIEKIKLPLDGASFIQGDLDKGIELPDNSFDLIISIETIEHLLNPGLFLKEISRTVKLGGQLIITTPNIHNIFSRILFLLTGELQWYREWCIAQRGGHVFPINEVCLKKILLLNGFEILDMFTTTGRILGTQVVIPIRGRFWGEVWICWARKGEG